MRAAAFHLTEHHHNKQPHLCRSRTPYQPSLTDGISASQRSRLQPRYPAARLRRSLKGLREGIRLKSSCTYVTAAAHPCRCRLNKPTWHNITISSGSTRTKSLFEVVALQLLSPPLFASLELAFRAPTETTYIATPRARVSTHEHPLLCK